MVTSELVAVRKNPSVLDVLREVEGQSLTIVQLSQMTGLNIQEVKKEVNRLVYNGSNVCFHRGVVFIPSSKPEFPIYLTLFVCILACLAYTMIQSFIK